MSGVMGTQCGESSAVEPGTRPVVPLRLFVDDLVRCPKVAPLGEYGSARGRGPVDDAGVRGPACSGCGHVDRLIT